MRRMIVGIATLVAVVVVTGCGSEELSEIPYNPDFTNLVTEGKVASVEIIQEPSGVTVVRGETELGQHPGPFIVYGANVEDILPILNENGVQFTVIPRNPVGWQYMISVLPVLLIGAMWLIWVGIIIFVLILAVRLVRAVERIAKNTEKD
jgi:hypothetical protein